MQLPKVLILNQPFVTDTGGGITMSNLFSGWETDKLAVVCLGYILNSNIDPGPCNNYYQLGHEERKWLFPFNLLSRKYQSGPIRFSDTSKTKVVDDSQKSKTRVGFIMKYVNPALEFLGFTNFITQIVLSKRFRDWLDEYNPDVIYAQCSSRESIQFCIAVQEYLGKPSVHHVMDDWPSLIGVKGFMSAYWQKKINTEFQHLLDITDVHLCISDFMGEAYKKRYGKDFITFHNPIDVDFWQGGQKLDYELSKNPTILYAGRVGLGIDKSLKLIAKAVANVNAEMGLSVRFIIQAQKAPVWIKDHQLTEHKGFVPYGDLPKEFGSADFLILPYDFSTKSLAYIKYSMPTKASEYMASGTPILIYAPENTALVQYAREHQWAAIVNQQEIGLLTSTLKKLFTDKNLRQEIAGIAKKRAELNHDTKIVAKNFQKIIVEAAKTAKS